MTVRGGSRNREEPGLPGTLKRNVRALTTLAAALAFAAFAQVPRASAAQIEVCFSPPLPG